jgi:Uma2 family endonuclease
MQALTKKLLEIPTIDLIMEEINKELTAEKELRKKFYEDIDEDQKAEFINGQIILHSPVTKRHSDAGRRLLYFLDKYVSTYHLGFLGYEKTLVELTRNSYEPDICYFRQEKAIHFTDEHNIFPSPDFVIEILSKRTEKYDRTIKYKDYQAHNVKEYWIVNTKRKEVEQYILINDVYELEKKHKTGIITCQAIPGFCIETEIIFDRYKYEEEVQKETRELFKAKNIIIEKENQLVEKENQLVEKENQLVEKENIISENQMQLAEKEKLLAEKERIIYDLMQKLK